MTDWSNKLELFGRLMESGNNFRRIPFIFKILLLKTIAIELLCQSISLQTIFNTGLRPEAHSQIQIAAQEFLTARRDAKNQNAARKLNNLFEQCSDKFQQLNLKK